MCPSALCSSSSEPCICGFGKRPRERRRSLRRQMWLLYVRYRSVRKWPFTRSARASILTVPSHMRSSRERRRPSCHSKLSHAWDLLGRASPRNRAALHSCASKNASRERRASSAVYARYCCDAMELVNGTGRERRAPVARCSLCPFSSHSVARPRPLTPTREARARRAGSVAPRAEWGVRCAHASLQRTVPSSHLPG